MESNYQDDVTIVTWLHDRDRRNLIMAATPEDLFIRHQIQLGQFSQSQIRDMVSVLEESHASIISKLQGRKVFGV